MIRVAGVDGWKGKWVAVFLENGAYAGTRIFESLAELSTLKALQVIGVDVPIGLVDTGSREADTFARGKLGPRRSSVFNAPPAFALDPAWTNYRKTNAESKRLYDKGISAQAFALMKNIREADAVARRDQRIHEVHPELSFWAMNDETPLGFAKKTWNGQADRMALLEKFGINIPCRFADAALGKIQPDDLVDAGAAAWSAHRIAVKTAAALPDSKGRGKRIWY